MMESRNSYGWGMTGSDKKGFEWELVDEYGKLLSGDVYKTADEAIRECRKYCKESECRGKSENTTIRAIPASLRSLNIRRSQYGRKRFENLPCL